MNLETETTIADLPPESEWSALRIDDKWTASEVNDQFQQAMRQRSALEGAARVATREARLAKELAPYMVEGRVNLTKEVLAAKHEKVDRQLDDEYSTAVRDGQRLRVVAGVLLQQELNRAIEPPSRAGSLGFTASVDQFLLAKQVDLLERQDARQWLALASPSEALDRSRRAYSRDDKGFIAVLDQGALPGKHPESDDEIAALGELIRLRDAQKVARISPQLRDHVKAYRDVLTPTSTERTLRLIRNLKAIA
jgi:hypothetical protein